MHTTYRGIDVYKLDHWTQGPVMLQALNILENFDLKPMGYNSAQLHPHDLPGDEPRLRRPRLLLRRSRTSRPRSRSRDCSRRSTRSARGTDLIRGRNDPAIGPGDPYPFQGGTNPFARPAARSALPPRCRRSTPQRFAAATDPVDGSVLSRHDFGRRGRRGRLGGLDDAARRLDARRRSPAAPASA